MPKQLIIDRFGENVMVNRGALVKVTSNPNEALEWLRLISANKADAGDDK
jgi:hypothetical protein